MKKRNMLSRTRRETSFASGKRTLRSEERSMPRLGIAIALVVLAAFGLSGAVASAASPNQKCDEWAKCLRRHRRRSGDRVSF